MKAYAGGGDEFVQVVVNTAEATETASSSPDWVTPVVVATVTAVLGLISWYLKERMKK